MLIYDGISIVAFIHRITDRIAAKVFVQQNRRRKFDSSDQVDYYLSHQIESIVIVIHSSLVSFTFLYQSINIIKNFEIIAIVLYSF